MTVKWNGYDRDISPTLKSAVDAAWGPLPFVVSIEGGIRDAEEQHDDFLKGRDEDGNIVNKRLIVTNADYTQSPHVRGGAVDGVPIVNGKKDWSGNSAPWQQMVSAVRGTPGLKSGADFVLDSGSTDPGHAELLNWRLLGIPGFAADATAVAMPSGDTDAGGDVSAGDDFFDQDESFVAPASDSWLQLNDGFVIGAAAVVGVALLVAGLVMNAQPQSRRRTA